MRTIKTTNNFAPGQCTGLVQDVTGFIWISTLEFGLFRFDGKNLKQYKADQDNRNTIASNAIYQIYEDSRHRLWLFFLDGQFDVFDPLTEKVRHLSAELGVKQKMAELRGTAEGNVNPYHSRSLFEDSRQRMWVVADAYVTMIDEGKSSIHFFVNAWAGISASSILSVNETANGNLLLVTMNEIVEIDGGNRIGRRTALPKGVAQNTKDPYYNNMSICRDDTLYAACPAGLMMYDCKTGNTVLKGGLPATCIDAKTVVSPAHDRFLFYDTARSHHLYEYAIHSNGPKDLGRYWYSNTARLDVRNDAVVEIYRSMQTGNNRFESSGKLFYLYDRFGNLWHGGEMAAVYWGPLAKPPFVMEKYTGQHTWQMLEDFLGIPATVARNKPFLQAPMIGTPEGAIYYIDSARRFSLCVPAPYAANTVKGSPRWAVYKRGFYSGLQADDEWRDGKLWVYDRRKREFFIMDTLQNSTALDLSLPPDVSVASFASSGSNTCWVTFLNMPQLALYQIGKGFVKIISNTKGKMPLPNVVLQKIIRDKFNQHVFWITTPTSGILRFNETDETWQLLTEKDGFPSGVVYDFVQDQLGYLWYNTQSGIYRFDTRSNTNRRIISTELLVNPFAGFQGDMGHLLNNQLYWSSGTHVIAIKADSVKESPDVTVALTGLQVNNQQIEAGDSSGLTTMAVNALHELRLAHNQNFVHFLFTALEYNQPTAVRYRYQLEDIDKTWVDAGTASDAQYTSLPPGHYTFKVNATNEDGAWSREIKTISIIISPPWWQTWWMYVVYAGLLFASGWAFMRTRLRRLQLRQQVVLKQKEAEQAQAMEETKSRFFANITHELRTPLTLILSPVQKQLGEGAATYSPQLLQGVYHNTKILLRLINQLLDMSKLEGGNMQLVLSRGNLPLFVEGLVVGFRGQAAARSINLMYQHEAATEDYLFDADKLEKILYNLLSNAFKFTPDGGDITLGVQIEKKADNQHTATITVADSGIGISPEHLPHVFDRFYQVAASNTRKYEGTGIGLSLVKELAQLMSGSAKAESTEGKGSVFTVSLPLTVAAEKDNVPLVNHQTESETPIPVKDAAAIIVTSEDTRPLVLVVDDNEGLRRFTADSLAPQYRVLTAVNGAAGLQTALAELPEIIISDVMMPVMDGYEFCQKIKEAPLTSHIAFVMLTAKTADESRMSGLRFGADHYLGKPFHVDELLLVISNLLKRQQALKEHYSKQLSPTEKLLPVNEVEDAFLQQVYSIIEANLDSDKLDVDFLASELAVSRRTLNRKLSAIAGTSANEIIRHYRLKKAAELLLAGHRVNDVAYATGFSTPSWFSQCFKEVYGMSPVQYAKNGGLS